MADITELFNDQLQTVEPGTPVTVFFGLSYDAPNNERILLSTRMAVLAGQPIVSDGWNINIMDGVYATGSNTNYIGHQASIPMFEVVN